MKEGQIVFYFPNGHDSDVEREYGKYAVAICIRKLQADNFRIWIPEFGFRTVSEGVEKGKSYALFELPQKK